MSNDIIKFYSGEKVDTCNHILSEIWTYSFQRLEEGHDYIQWLFPLDEPSAYNLDAPLLTKEDIEALREPEMLCRVLLSVHTYMRFLFFTREYWVTKFDHNHLRITRMLKCLKLLGMTHEAHARLREVMLIAASTDPNVNLDTAIQFWENAVGRG
jgi:hypothetical protein